MARATSSGHPSHTQCTLTSSVADSASRDTTSWGPRGWVSRAVTGATGSSRQSPAGSSTTAQPPAASSSRRASAVAKSWPARALARASASAIAWGSGVGASVIDADLTARSGGRGLGRVAQPSRHLLQGLHGDRGVFLHQATEYPLGEPEHRDVGRRRDRCGARAAVEQRDLTEEVAGPEGSLLLAA